MSTASKVIAQTDTHRHTHRHTCTHSHMRDENITSTAYVGGNKIVTCRYLDATLIADRNF